MWRSIISRLSSSLFSKIWSSQTLPAITVAAKNSYKTAHCITRSYFISGFYALLADVTQLTKKREPKELTPEQKEKHRLVCLENEEAVSKLMVLLSTCVATLSEKYREALTKQMDLSKQRSSNEKNNELEAEVMKCREDATYFIEELHKFQQFVTNIEKMAMNLAVASHMAGNANAKDLICKEFCRMERLIAKELSENYQCELEFIIVCHDCFLRNIQNIDDLM